MSSAASGAIGEEIGISLLWRIYHLRTEIETRLPGLVTAEPYPVIVAIQDESSNASNYCYYLYSLQTCQIDRYRGYG